MVEINALLAIEFPDKDVSYQNRKSHCGDETILLSYYPHTRISFIIAMAYV